MHNTYPISKYIGIHVHITSKNAVVHKLLQSSERYGTQISLNMTLETRSEIKGHCM